MHSAAYGRTCSISDASEPAIWKPMTRSSLADTTTLTSSFTSLRPSVFFMGLACVAQELGFKKQKPLRDLPTLLLACWAEPASHVRVSKGS